MMSLSTKIKAAREKMGYTQQRLADEMEVNRSTIANYEIGRRVPDFEDLQKLAKILNVSVDYFAEKQNLETINDFMARAKVVFDSAEIKQSDKENIFQDIMKLYLKTKE